MKPRSMVGREGPLRALEAALAAPPRVALVSGEAGIGKTRLVAELEAAADGWLVLHGECVEFGGEALAYAPVVAALRDVPADWLQGYLGGLSGEARAALAAVFPRETPGGGGPGRLYELLLDLLGALDRPVLLVLEDIHWADRSTLTLLAFLARNLRAQPIVVLATYRVDDALPDGLRRLAGELRRRRTVLWVELSPLGRDDVARQVEAIAGLEVGGEPAPTAPEADGVGLTTRETEVLKLLVDGLTNHEIAARLFISQKTVGPTWRTSTPSSTSTRGCRSRAGHASSVSSACVLQDTCTSPQGLERIPPQGSHPGTLCGVRERPQARNVLPVTGVHEGRRKIRRPFMSPSSISRLCAGVAITLVLFVVTTGVPASAQTHAQIHTHS